MDLRVKALWLPILLGFNLFFIVKCELFEQTPEMETIEPEAPPKKLAHLFKDSLGQSHRVLQFFAEGIPKRQAVVIYFGGGWKKGAAYTMEPFCQGFTQAGYHCFAPSYRTSEYDGTGVAEAMYDAQMTFSWLQNNANELGFDSELLWSAGVSAGGLLAAWQESRGHFLWVPVLKTYGPDSYESELLDEEYSQEIDVLRNLEVSIQPKPSYIFVPQIDTIVPLKGSEEYCQILTANDVPCQRVQLEVSGHEFFSDEPDVRDSTVAWAIEVMEAI